MNKNFSYLHVVRVKTPRVFVHILAQVSMLRNIERNRVAGQCQHE